MERKYGVKIWSGNMELKMERKYVAEKIFSGRKNEVN
jgi:hypothetical protein